MLRIPCPYCGERDHTEFNYGGDATVTMPPIGSEDSEAWFDFVYLRDNPRGAHREYWQHTNGCRQWLVVERDTQSHVISSARPARDGAAEAAT